MTGQPPQLCCVTDSDWGGGGGVWSTSVLNVVAHQVCERVTGGRGADVPVLAWSPPHAQAVLAGVQLPLLEAEREKDRVRHELVTLNA